MKKWIGFVFVFSGAKLFMDYVLPTNPASKNIFINRLYGGCKHFYTYESRLKFAYTAGIIHVCSFVINTCVFLLDPYGMLKLYLIINIPFNVYPLIIQFYFWNRCASIKKRKLSGTN